MKKLFFFLAAALLTFCLNSTILAEGIGAKKIKIATIDPFKVKGMTVVSPIKDGVLTPFASNFAAWATVTDPKEGNIFFKAIGLHNTDFCIYINFISQAKIFSYYSMSRIIKIQFAREI